jgi:hypothetical protein
MIKEAFSTALATEKKVVEGAARLASEVFDSNASFEKYKSNIGCFSGIIRLGYLATAVCLASFLIVSKYQEHTLKEIAADPVQALVSGKLSAEHLDHAFKLMNPKQVQQVIKNSLTYAPGGKMLFSDSHGLLKNELLDVASLRKCLHEIHPDLRIEKQVIEQFYRRTARGNQGEETELPPTIPSKISFVARPR